ncbi:hypothetical protein BBN63_00410 [Streptomyces niveus]|uniref:Sensor histidine kinase n=1 Tax=Streptomyces niveus TaxID=193462 RepID=A0A1U9QL03_STRNV|nr:hypothetical protein BBN63_00410 [Streptomyces niveus]
MSWRDDARAAHRDRWALSDGALLAAARSLVFATTGTALAVTGHHLASGRPVSWPTAWLACSLLFLLALPFSRRPRSLCAVMSATGAVQALLHF